MKSTKVQTLGAGRNVAQGHAIYSLYQNTLRGVKTLDIIYICKCTELLQPLD